MKKTPTEQKALKAAKEIEPMPATANMEIRRTPYAQRTITQRRAILADDLRRAADTFEQRERSNDLYHHYLKTGNITEARYHAPSPLVDSTQSLRRNLSEAWKALLAFDNQPLAPHTTNEPKRWMKSQRYFMLLDVQRAIERNGGKVRYRQRQTKKDLIYARVIAPANNPKQPAEPQQMALGL